MGTLVFSIDWLFIKTILNKSAHKYHYSKFGVKMQQVYPFNLTFLFADIGGSTQLEQLHPQEMPTALARHHELLRHATETHFGYIFQIIGDAFCTTCSTALDGLQAVAHAQRALQIEPWGNNLADLLASIQYPMGNSGTTGEAVEPHLSSADGA